METVFLNKTQKLEILDTKLIDAMLDIMENKNYELLSDLASVSNYLAKNNKVQEKEKSSLEDEIKTKVKEAEARRNT